MEKRRFRTLSALGTRKKRINTWKTSKLFTKGILRIKKQNKQKALRSRQERLVTKHREPVQFVRSILSRVAMMFT